MSKTELVTGASSGIGIASAEALVARGYTVYAGARRVDRMGGLARAGAHVVGLDVTDDASMKAAVDAVPHETGRIDVLLSNAGYSQSRASVTLCEFCSCAAFSPTVRSTR